MPVNAVIQTHELTKRFMHPLFFWLVRARALNGLTMSIEKGEVFGLLGPNGSGKSTTIKLILGMLWPTSGEVALFGHRPNDVRVKEKIGYLPEDSHLYRFLNAEETLDFYGRLFHLPRQERRKRIDALLEMTGLKHERKRPVAEFSKGMQRRIGLAQALINDPQLVILDEPTSGLDPLGTREIKNLIVELKDKGKTVLLSSHLLADVEDVCDRVAILYGGRVRAQGPVKTLLSDEKRVQITAEMDAQTVAEVTELIRRRDGAEHEVRVGPPMERLENLFMRVVSDAEREGVHTSGASAQGKARIEFLSNNEEPDSLLTSLSAPGKSPVKAEVTASAPVAVSTFTPAPQEMLAGLVRDGGKSADIAAQTEAQVRKADISDTRPDSGLLDQLTKK